ncbi:FkbM family methyltransferase [Tolypothrix sp. VBCCA 56010]|uniref:FkbM family methyltransferase n=1 Tax=Tolypothrix sp. VBCCA 56010 TaxID=3137731 RepID=UPI003D7E6CFB
MVNKYRLERIARLLLFPSVFLLTILKIIKIQVGPMIGRQTRKQLMLDMKYLCNKHSVIPRGVIHIGAHEGREINLYREMGIKNIFFIEANPVVFDKMKENIKDNSNILSANCAITNSDGKTTLYVTSNDLSSSILPLKYHKQIYPSIVETHQVIVPSKTLDSLLQEEQLEPSDFNIINIDIQGAELIAFQGAINTLKYIEAINTEVNYRELYEGCAIIYQIDEFLEMHGFKRVATTTPFHPSWGDAFYVKKKAVS